MYKLQKTINQKIEGFLSSLSPNDLATLQSRLEEVPALQQPKREEIISTLHQNVVSIVPPEYIQKYRHLKRQLKSNNQTLEIIRKGRVIGCKLEEYLSLNNAQLQRGRSLLLQVIDSLNQFEQLSSFSFTDFNILREQLYTQILVKIDHSEQQFANRYEEFKKGLEVLALPLKKGEIRTERPEMDVKNTILNLMHRQSCLITLRRQLHSLLQKEDDSPKERLLQFFWNPSVKTIVYLFASGSELHNLEEPGWMFEYLQLTLNSNYKYFQDHMLGHLLRPDVERALNNYFLEGSVESLFMKSIEARIKEDIKFMNPFLCFNFLDQVSGLQFKLHSSFGLRACLLQKILIKNQKLLDSSFQYQNQRFQTKIFQDFININYSQINLKNMEAYNLMTAFLNMLEILQTKYTFVSYPSLKKRISKFYRERIMVLVAHLKTSFDRIYHHSRLPKLDILVSFKRTENQLRSNLSKLTLNDSELDDSLQKEYYCFLEKYYEAAALEALTPVHKKVHISLGDIMNKLQSPDQSNHDLMLQGFSKIQQEWATKMDKISKFSGYVDTKLKGIFFTYLQALEFSSVGLNLYLKIFEPFLQVIFTEERHRTLISLITTEQERYMEFMEAHPSSLTFLTPDETAKLNKFKSKKPTLEL